MNTELIIAMQQPFIGEKTLPNIRVGMEVEVSQKIKDGEKTRIQKFRGLVVKMAGKTPLEKTITVRKESEGIAIEKVVALYSPATEKVEIVRTFKVRRANLAYISRSKKAIRLKEIKG